MADLTSKSYLTSGTTQEAQFQQGVGALYDFVAQLAGASAPQFQAIVDGVLTPDGSSGYIITDTENSTATDILNNISPQYIGAKTIYLKTTSSARKLTLKHMGSGTGQIYLSGEADITMDSKNCLIALHYNPTLQIWEEVWKNWGLYIPSTTQRDAARTALGLGNSAYYAVGTGTNQIPLSNQLGALAFKATIDLANLIADGIIPLSKLASGTPNNIISYGSDGKPTSIAMPSSKALIRNKVFTGALGTDTPYTLSIPAGVYGMEVLLVGGGGGGSAYGAGVTGGSTTGLGITCTGGAGGRGGQTDSSENLSTPGTAAHSLLSGIIAGEIIIGNAHWYNYYYYSPSPGIDTPSYRGAQVGMGGAAGTNGQQTSFPPGDKGGPGGLFKGVLYNPSGAAITTTLNIGAGGGGGSRYSTYGVAGGNGSPGYASFSWIEPIA